MLDYSQIKIVGVGGAGISAVNDIHSETLGYIETVAIDTDCSTLEKCSAAKKIALTKNREGTGGDTSAAQEAAVAHGAELAELAVSTKLLVIVAGLGGGTGSIVAPFISKLAAENQECVTLSFAITPLSIEGSQRAVLALRAFNYLSKRCSAVFSLPNDVILARLNAPISEAFAVSNSNVVNAIYAIVKMLTSRASVSIDFATIKKIFTTTTNARTAFIAYGTGCGAQAVDEAVSDALKSPLLPKNFCAKSMIVSLRCGKNFEMNKMQYLLETASKKFGSPARMAFGAITEDAFDENIEICIMGLCETSESDTSQNETDNLQTSANSDLDTFPEDEIQSESTTETISNSEENSDDLPPSENFSNTSATSEKSFSSAEQSVSENAADFSAVNIAPVVDARQSPAPVLAQPEERPRKKSFFGFGHGKQKKAQDASTPDKSQTEFEFMELSQQRGFFQDTPPNIKNGIDLDVPTYMRKGIKIVI